MTSRSLIQALSLVANVVLAIAIADRMMHWTEGGTESPPSASRGVGLAAIETAPTPAAEPALDPEAWASLTRGDLGAAASRLQAEGFPPMLQRVILGALISARFADRHRALADKVRTQPWWTGGTSTILSAEIIEERQHLWRDEKEVLDRLIEPDAGISPYTLARQRRQFGDLPAAKQSELSRITSDYDELGTEIRNRTRSVLLPEDRQKLEFLENEKRADVTKLLNPEELFEYDLRSSPTAAQLRDQLSAFHATDEEYRTIFRLQQAFDSQFGHLDLLSADQRRQRELAQATLNEKIQGVLSSERFAEYQQKTDPLYLGTAPLVARLNLPAAATAEIVGIQKDITQRADTIRYDPSLSAIQRDFRLRSLVGEATLRLSTPLGGEAGLTAYRQFVGRWLSQLERSSSNPPGR